MEKWINILIDTNGVELNAFLCMLQLREFEVKEQFFMEIVHNRWNTDKLDKLLANLDLKEIYFQHEFQFLDFKRLIVSVEYMSAHELTDNVLIVSFNEQESRQKKEVR